MASKYQPGLKIQCGKTLYEISRPYYYVQYENGACLKSNSIKELYENLNYKIQDKISIGYVINFQDIDGNWWRMSLKEEDIDEIKMEKIGFPKSKLWQRDPRILRLCFRTYG